MNSYMPSSIRAWNKVETNIKGRESLDSFKYHLKKSMGRKKNKLYSRFNGSKAINHTRMRLGLSGLQAQRHDYNHVPLPKCNQCGARKEDVMHYMLQCRVFATMRTSLLNDVIALYRSRNINWDLSRTIVQKELIRCLLSGDPRSGEHQVVQDGPALYLH